MSDTLARLLSEGVDVGLKAFIIDTGDGIYRNYSCPKISPSKKFCDWGMRPSANGYDDWVRCDEINIIEEL